MLRLRSLLNCQLTPQCQTQKDIPEQLLVSTTPLSASILVASFGETQPFNKRAFNLKLPDDPQAPQKTIEKPLRYGKLPEIHHTFRTDPKSPPKIFTLFFTAAVLVALPALFGTVCTTDIKVAVDAANVSSGCCSVPI